MAACRESYGDAEGVLCHLGNVDVPLKAVLAGPADLDHLEVHGPASEIEKLKPALGPLGAQFFVTGWGFRNATPLQATEEEKLKEPLAEEKLPQPVEPPAKKGGLWGAKKKGLLAVAAQKQAET